MSSSKTFGERIIAVIEPDLINIQLWKNMSTYKAVQHNRWRTYLAWIHSV